MVKSVHQKKMMAGEECCGGKGCDSAEKMNEQCSGGGCEGGSCHGEMSGHCGEKGGRHCPGKMFVKLSAGILFLILAFYVGNQIWGAPWYKNLKAEVTSQPYARTISVDGEGKITTKPDIARISLSVVATGKTVKLVTEDSNKKMAAVIGEMKNLGIKSEDIQTSQYNLYPEYDYSYYQVNASDSKPRQPAIIGYNLSQTLDVKVRDLTKTDDVLDKSVAVGANQVGSLVFDLDDASVVKNQAREMAFQKAKEKAQQMAKAAGVNLARVVTFSEGFTGGVTPYANFAMKSDMMSASVAAPAAIESGSKELTVSVSVTYEIE